MKNMFFVSTPMHEKTIEERIFTGENKTQWIGPETQWSASHASIQEFKKNYRRKTMYEVQIKKVNQGFIVDIGCQTFAVTDEKKMFQALSEYFKDPKKAEEKYCDKKGETA